MFGEITVELKVQGQFILRTFFLIKIKFRPRTDHEDPKGE